VGPILLVDDDPRALSAMVRQFEEQFETATAADADAAITAASLAVARGAPFTVAVCDMHMPGMNGLECLRHIRRISPGTVAIMLTGDADQRTVVDAINSGNIFRFFVKPIDSRHLADGIAAALRQHDLLEAEQRLVENEERWRLALEAVGDGAWDWVPQTGKVIYSKGWRQALDLPPASGEASLDQWSERIHPEDADAVAAALDRLTRRQDKALQCEHRLRAADGSYRWFLARGTVLQVGGDGAASRVIGTLTDVTDRRLMEDKLRRQAEELALLATTDALTGLWNRRRFLEQAEEELHRAQRYGRPVSAVMIDIDHFKRVNDSHGHAIGDQVLRRIAEILRGNLRKSDSLGRIGGEEFAAILPESDGARASVVAELLRCQVAADSLDLDDGQQLRITASFGVASGRGDGDTVAMLLGRADKALYAAKEGGRDRVVLDGDGR